MLNDECPDCEVRLKKGTCPKCGWTGTLTILPPRGAALSWEFTSPAELLDPEAVPRLVKELVAELSLDAPRTPGVRAEMHPCSRCGIAFAGDYREPVCSNCWFTER